MFTTPAWEGQLDDGSALVHVLNKLPLSVDGLYSKISLCVLGLLWCAGSDNEKVAILLRLVNPPHQIQGAICNQDKELRMSVRLLVKIATVSTITAAATAGKDMFMPRMETPIESLI